MQTTQRKCSAMTQRGTPCRRWAVAGSEPPSCTAHGGRPRGEESGDTPGLCLSSPLPVELDRAPGQGEMNLDAEIAMARLCLLRVAEAYGSRPQFLLASASIANPGEHAARLTSRECAVVDDDGSPAGPRTVVFFDAAAPGAGSPLVQTRDVFARLVKTSEAFVDGPNCGPQRIEPVGAGGLAGLPRSALV